MEYDIYLREHPSKLRLRVALTSALIGRSRSSNAIVLRARWEIRGSYVATSLIRVDRVDCLG